MIETLFLSILLAANAGGIVAEVPDSIDTIEPVEELSSSSLSSSAYVNNYISSKTYNYNGYEQTRSTPGIENMFCSGTSNNSYMRSFL